MDIETEAELKAFVQQHRNAVSENFKAYCDHIEAGLANGNWPVLALRGDKTDKEIHLANAALQEIHLLFCTNDKKYSDVRKRTGGFVKVALPTISAYVAGACGGVGAAAASAAAGLVALTVLRVGKSVFCRIAEAKLQPSTKKKRIK